MSCSAGSETHLPSRVTLLLAGPLDATTVSRHHPRSNSLWRHIQQPSSGANETTRFFFFTPTFSIRVLSVSSCECSTKTLPCYPLHRSTAAALMFKSLTSIYPQAAATYQSCAPRCLTQYRTHQQPCNRSAKCNGRTKQDGEAA